jgi:hypothetical protein
MSWKPLIRDEHGRLTDDERYIPLVARMVGLLQGRGQVTTDELIVALAGVAEDEGLRMDRGVVAWMVSYYRHHVDGDFLVSTQMGDGRYGYKLTHEPDEIYAYEIRGLRSQRSRAETGIADADRRVTLTRRTGARREIRRALNNLDMRKGVHASLDNAIDFLEEERERAGRLGAA